MAWIRVDDRFFSSGEARTAGPRAALLYLELITYGLRFNLSGTIPKHAARFVAKPRPSDLSILVDVGLLLETEQSYVIVERWVESDVVVDARPIPDRVRAAVLTRDGYLCRLCGTDEDLCVDHIVSRTRGGESKPHNLQTLCRQCNSEKGAW